MENDELTKASLLVSAVIGIFSQAIQKEDFLSLDKETIKKYLDKSKEIGVELIDVIL